MNRFRTFLPRVSNAIQAMIAVAIVVLLFRSAV